MRLSECVTSLLLASLATAQQLSSTLQQITTDFGPNPRNVSFYIYVPKKLAPNPPILVAPHWCTGTAQAVFNGRSWASVGDQYGFIAIYPETANVGKCWDVSSTQSLTHNGGGDAQGIVSMVKWTLKKYNGDASRVFVTGTSSGAMMTNVLLGSYPEVFAAGSVWAGVAFGCFSGDGFGVWNAECATGKRIMSGSAWAAMVKNADPGYRGFRAKVQTFHGSEDEVVNPQNLIEQVKQWTSVFGVSETPTEVTPNTPLPGWTRRRYGNKFEATTAANVTHNIPNQDGVVIDYFGLRCVKSNTKSCYSRQHYQAKKEHKFKA